MCISMCKIMSVKCLEDSQWQIDFCLGLRKVGGGGLTFKLSHDNISTDIEDLKWGLLVSWMA